jgi:hypothetical protein
MGAEDEMIVWNEAVRNARVLVGHGGRKFHIRYWIGSEYSSSGIPLIKIGDIPKWNRGNGVSKGGRH